MDIDHAVAILVKAMLPRFSGNKKVLAMKLHIRAAKPSDYRKEVARHVHILFHRPNNYTNVLWNADSRNRYKDLSVWEVKCSHDSEWRTDGLATPMFHLGLQMVKELDPEARPIDCEVIARFDLTGEPKLVTIADYKYNRHNSTFTIKWE